MSLGIGIVGLPNVGKSTLFEAITKKQVSRANYPFCTIDSNVGVVAVPDERVDKVAEIIHSAKKIYATVKFVDIAGLVKNASQGEGLGNKFLANIRETDSIVYILRAFKNPNIINTRSKIDPIEEKEILDTELALKDLEVVEKRIDSLRREIKAGNPEVIKEMPVLKRARDFLKEGKVLIDEAWAAEEEKILNNYQLLTIKKRLYLLNGSEEEIPKEVLEIFNKNNWPYLIMDILAEFDAASLTSEERQEFGLVQELKLDALIKKAYELSDLITFFSILSDETRAWTVQRGSSAAQAGAAIHTDFEKHFIKAEVINWHDLVEAKGFHRAREHGLVRTEGRDYIVQDGDVIEIKSNA